MTTTEKRLKEAIKILRKEYRESVVFYKRYLKNGDIYDAIEMKEWGAGIKYTLDNIEEYIKNGRML